MASLRKRVASAVGMGIRLTAISQEVFYPGKNFRHCAVCCVPNDVDVDIVVGVYQTVSHTRHSSPRYFGITITSFLWNALSSFSRNLERANNCVLCLIFGFEFFAVHRFRKFDNQLKISTDIFQWFHEHSRAYTEIASFKAVSAMLVLKSSSIIRSTGMPRSALISCSRATRAIRSNR